MSYTYEEWVPGATGTHSVEGVREDGLSDAGPVTVPTTCRTARIIRRTGEGKNQDPRGSADDRNAPAVACGDGRVTVAQSLQ